MSFKIYLFGLLIISFGFFSCIRETETLLEVVVKNGTNEPVKLHMFADYASPDYSDTIIINMSPGTDYTWTSSSRGGGGNNYPSGLHNFPPGDSLHVIFNDTLSVTHFTYSAGYNSTHIDSSVIEYYEPRNIYNPDNYSQKMVKKDFFRGTYTLTDADLNYALSIHE